MYYYSSAKDDQEVIDKLQDLAERYPTRGFETYYGKIRMEGLRWNRKRVLRLYRMLNLKMRRKRKRRLPARVKESLVVPTFLNETWSSDFMSDTLVNGRKFRVLNVIDDHNREALKAHPLSPFIELIEGSSVDPSVISRVKKLIPTGSKVMVILDSNHTHSHVFSELEAFASLISVGGYLIVHDTGIEFAPNELFEDRAWGKGDNPLSALDEFLMTNSNFRRTTLVNAKLLISSSPSGYVQRVA
jgi:hypothetical protein